MKAKTLKAFTLVEILIVIVIIGILIGALVPRMQSAQGRARDVARKNDLSQLQAAIVTSFQDKGRYPCAKSGCKDTGHNCTSMAYGSGGVSVNCFGDLLLAAGMNGVPSDPLKSTMVTGLGKSGVNNFGTIYSGQYRYILVKSYGSPNGAFVLMAKTEVEGGSNWVVSGDVGLITGGSDIKDLKPCTSLEKGTAVSNPMSGGNCTYTNESQLRYVLFN